ncbi:hypothetical protein DYB35_013046 [Aphanomyces astaci]|uniref:Transposase Tc1-like domain-containing protein n=1 Tax=Aphanomyces astaci TaxID=112090 RepID=A0A3R6ZK80_APHAT|nr:hypothetical protein DYB35_013046 [Aphanomyces astaci]
MTQASHELSITTRSEVIRHLHQYVKGGRLTHGAFAKTAEELGISARVVSTTWRKYRADGTSKSKKSGNVGRRLRYTAQAIRQRVGAVPMDQRSTIREMSVATGISIGTLSRHLKKGTFRRRSTRIKLLLSEAKKLERVQFYLWDVVPLEEKWFNADKDRRTVYLLPDKTPQRRSWKSKRFIPKVMFLAAVARPRYDEGRGSLFDGKVGMLQGYGRKDGNPIVRCNYSTFEGRDKVEITEEGPHKRKSRVDVKYFKPFTRFMARDCLLRLDVADKAAVLKQIVA